MKDFSAITERDELSERKLRSRKRWQTIIVTGSTGFGAKLLALLFSLAQVSIALNYLGDEAFGLWMTITSTMALFAFADLGIGNGMQNAISHAFGRDSRGEIFEVFASGFVLMALIGALLFVVLTIICFSFDWARILSVNDPHVAGQTVGVLLVCVAVFCAGLPLTSVQKLALAMQVGWMVNIWTAIGGLASLLMVFVAVKTRQSLPLCVAASILPLCLSNAGLFLHLSAHFGWNNRAFLCVRKRHFRSLLSSGVLFALPQIGASLIFMAPPVLIAGILGAAAVTPYNLIQRLLSIFAQLQMLILIPLWPAVADAKARNDFSWIRSTYNKMLLLSLVFTVIPSFLFALWGPPFLHVWTGKPADYYQPFLLWTMSAWTAVGAFSQPCAYVLNGLGNIKGQASYGLVSSLLAVAVMPFCLARFGVAGAPLACLAAFLPISTPLVLYETACRVGMRPPGGPFKVFRRLRESV